MKVLHVVTDTNIGGAGRYLIGLLKVIAEQYPEFLKETVVACPHGMLATEVAMTGVPVVYHGGRDTSFSPGLTVELFRLISRLKPNIVHTHACLSGRIAAKCLGIPVVYTKHSLVPGDVRGNPGTGDESPWKGLRRLVNGVTARCFSDKIIAVSRAVADALVASGVPSSMIVTIYNGVDPREYGPRPTEEGLGIPSENLPATGETSCREERERDSRVLTVGTVSRLHHDKGLDVLIDAARMLMTGTEGMTGFLADRSEVRFVVAGDGPERPALLERIAESGLSGRFLLTGYVRDVPGFLRNLDVFVLPSRTEALGLSILEAMATGLPVIATNVGGIPEVVVDSETGLLVQPGHPEDLCFALRRLLGDPELRTALGRRGRARVESLFDVRQTARKTLELYREIFEHGL